MPIADNQMENGKDPEKIKGNLGFCRVEGVQDLGFGVQGIGFVIEGSGCRVWAEIQSMEFVISGWGWEVPFLGGCKDMGAHFFSSIGLLAS